MATEKRVLTNLTPNVKGSFSRLNQQMCVCNGYEKPRYFDRSARAGYLGLEDWGTSTYTPVATIQEGGTLTKGLYYSAVFVPVDTRYADSDGNYRRGNPTLPSAGRLIVDTVGNTNRSINFKLPAMHPQKNFTEYSGYRISGGEIKDDYTAFKAALTAGSAPYPFQRWDFEGTVEGTAFNLTSSSGVSFGTTMTTIGEWFQTELRALMGTDVIFRWRAKGYNASLGYNTGTFEFWSDSTESTSALSISSPTTGFNIARLLFPDYTVSPTTTVWNGDGVYNYPSVLAPEADEVWVYCSQGSPTATLAETGAKYYIGKMPNFYTSASFGLSTGYYNEYVVLDTDPTTATDAVELDNFQPPALRHSTVMQNRMFGVTGVTESRGTVTWDNASKLFRGKSYGAFTISTITSLGNSLFRATFSGSPDLSAVTTSMRISLTGCATALNNIPLVPVLAVDNTAKTIDYRNEYGVADGAASGTATAYSTFIADGFVGAQFRFEADGVNQLYEILTVDWANQTFTTTVNYGGIKTPLTYYSFFVETADRTLWWSKQGDPNSWPTTNTLQFEEDLTADAPAGEYLAVFSRNNVYTVNPRAPEEGFRKTQAPIGTLSPFSIVPTETGVFFFDGKTIRQFDGLQAPDATRRKVRVFLEGLNELMLDQVHGVYLPNEQSIRWYVPYGSATQTNNNYVQYNVNTGFWWIGQSIDCSCATVLTDKTTGELDLYTGTSARYADIGQIQKHGGVETDGIDVGTTGVFGTVDSIVDASNTLTFTLGSGSGSVNDVGVPFNVFSATGTRDITGIIKTIVDNGSGTYTITYSDDFDLSTVVAGDWIAIGLPQFKWGIKWLDFGTPQYKHELKEIHLHFTPATYIYGIVDFYTDFDDVARKSVAFSISTGETKAVIRFHGERGYQMGFKIRAWSQYELEVRDMVIIHRSIV